MPYISWEKYHFSWLLLTTIIKRSLSGMLPEAADEVRNSGKMKDECYFRNGNICVCQQFTGFVHHFVTDVLLGTGIQDRVNLFIQIIGSNAKAVGIKLHGMLLFQVLLHQFYKPLDVRTVVFFGTG